MAKRTRKVHASEAQIQKACCDYLAMRGHFFWRNNSVGVYDSVKGIHRKPPAYSMNGTPDVLLIDPAKTGCLIGLEFKTASGRLSKDQRAFQKKCEEYNVEYYVIRDVDELVNIGL